MADIVNTIKFIGGNKLKTWLQKPENQEALKAAPADVQAAAMEKWAESYDGAPFPISLLEPSGQEDAPVTDTSFEAAPSSAPGLGIPGSPDHAGEPRSGDAAAPSPAPREALFSDPDSEREKPKAILMTEQQRYISNLVAGAAKDAPIIENVVELKTQLQMMVPKIIKKSRPEFTYKWTSKEDLARDLFKFGGIWEIVARVNHGHIPIELFGDEGAIVYGGQLILTFTRRSITDQLDLQTIKEFNFKADSALQNLQKGYGEVKGKEAIHLSISDQLPQEMTVGEEELVQDSEYDFEAPGEAASV